MAQRGRAASEFRSALRGGAAPLALRVLLFAAAGGALAPGVGTAAAETVGGALIKAYLNNPQINSARAGVRAADENIPAANAGYLPKVQAVGSAGVTHVNGNIFGNAITQENEQRYAYGSKPRSYGIEATQTLFDGNRTINRIRSAESGVLAQRESLRNTEQLTLLAGVTAYMDVLRDTALLELQRNNVLVLQEQLRETRDRFTVGEVTRTDVAQAEASLSTAQATALSAESTLEASIARYREIVGEQPTSLAPVKPLVNPLPRNLPDAVSISQVEHPQVVGALHSVDQGMLAVKIAEGALYPQVGVTGSLQQGFDVSNTPGIRAFSASVAGNITVPIYQGGAEYATIRQAKETLSESELNLDQTRDAVRANVVNFWGLNQASVGVVRAARAAVAANEVALAGVREEARVGQRTTLDVLNAQQALLTARSQLVSAEHDQVVNSYSLLSAVGRLNVPTLGLAVVEYDPHVHFNQVKGKLWGVRTPEGK